MSDESPDRILVARLIRGDEEAFSTFFDMSFPPIFGSALVATNGDRQAAEHGVQSALRRAVRKLETWRGNMPLHDWLLNELRLDLPAAALTAPTAERDDARRDRVRAAVHADWQAVTTRYAQRRVFTALGVAAVLAAVVIFVNCPRL